MIYLPIGHPSRAVPACSLLPTMLITMNELCVVLRDPGHLATMLVYCICCITDDLYIDSSTRLSVDWHDDYPWKPKSADEPVHPFLCALLHWSLLLRVFSAPFHAHFYIHSCNHNDLGVFIVLFITNVLPSFTTEGCQRLQSTTNVRTSHQIWRGGPHISTILKVCNLFVHDAPAVSK